MIKSILTKLQSNKEQSFLTKFLHSIIQSELKINI